MIAATVALVTLAYLAYRTATPGNGQLLISGILALLALITFLSIPKLDWQDEEAAQYRAIFDDMRARFPISIQFGRPPTHRSQAGATGGVFPNESAMTMHSFADPEVHRISGATLEEARRMDSEGRPIDDICRMIDGDHDLHDPTHQEVFRRLVRTVIEQA